MLEAVYKARWSPWVPVTSCASPGHWGGTAEGEGGGEPKETGVGYRCQVVAPGAPYLEALDAEQQESSEIKDHNDDFKQIRLGV